MARHGSPAALGTARGDSVFHKGSGEAFSGSLDRLEIWDGHALAADVAASAFAAGRGGTDASGTSTGGSDPGGTGTGTGTGVSGNATATSLVGASVGLAGLTSVTRSGGLIEVGGVAANAGGQADGLNVAAAEVSGDFVATVRLLSQSRSDNRAQAGLMLRGSLDADAKNVFLMDTTNAPVKLQARKFDGAGTQRSGTGGRDLGDWMRLERRGDTVTAFRSVDGVAWTSVGQRTITFGHTLHVALASSNSNIEQAGSAVFSDFSLQPLDGS